MEDWGRKREKLVNGVEGGARSALRLREGVNEHEAPGSVVDGGARWTNVATAVTDVARP